MRPVLPVKKRLIRQAAIKSTFYYSLGIRFGGVWLAQSEECATLDLGVVSSIPRWGSGLLKYIIFF